MNVISEPCSNHPVISSYILHIYLTERNRRAINYYISSACLNANTVGFSPAHTCNHDIHIAGCEGVFVNTHFCWIPRGCLHGRMVCGGTVCYIGPV